MADLGNIGTVLTAMPAVRIAPQLPLSAVTRLFGETAQSYLDRIPIFAAVDSPIPSVGLKSLETYTPGAFLFERPVDPGTTLTITVKCRRSADYVDSAMVGLSRGAQSTAPYLEVELPGGAKTRATKGATPDIFETLVVGPLTVGIVGVAVIRLVAEGNFGDNLLFVEEARRPIFVGGGGPRVWWADLVAVST